LVLHFEEIIGIGLYDYSQYLAPVLASFVYYFVIRLYGGSVKHLFGAIIFWFLISFVLWSATSTYVELSLCLALAFGSFIWLFRALKCVDIVVANFVFWFFNLVYLVFIFLPVSFFPKNHRDSIIASLFEEPMMLLFPFFQYDNSYIYSAHSFVFEGFRAFGILFLVICVFMVKSIIRPNNRVGSFLSLHIFTVCGLFSMPQMHLYTIPIILILPYLKWDFID